MNHRVTVNRVGAHRRATLNGRDYIVVPMTMIVSGVLRGSKGALFYPEKEVERTASDWNGMPILLGHPKGSGRTPDIINKYGVGTVFNAHFHQGRLRGEAWLDVLRLRTLAPESLSRVQAGGSLELSTGFFSGFDPTPGQFNGRTYNASVVGIRPDHLAVFTGSEVGACSVRDGCGINNEDLSTPLEDLIAWDLRRNGLPNNTVVRSGGKPTPLGLPAPMEFEPLRRPEVQRTSQRSDTPAPLGLPTMDFSDDVIAKYKRRTGR